jgi:beta-RFAP synthase
MIRVRTGSRLHFGLLSPSIEGAAKLLNQEGQPRVDARQFGGAGLMIDRPGIELMVDFAKAWSADGPLAERALKFAQAYCDNVGISEAFAIRIETAAPEHAGLGTGTQLALAVARVLAELTQQPARDAITLARNVGRGLRSAVGIHGFEQGGFLVEGGKRLDWKISPLVARHPFPEDWSILLVTPRGLKGAHGQAELDAFGGLKDQETNARFTETLCRLVLLGMLPALVARDLVGFGEALYEFNRQAGEMFRSAQGGIYADPRIEEIIQLLRGAGVQAVGQSSWGPTIFAITSPNQEAGIAHHNIRRQRFRNKLADCDITFVNPSNQGAEIVQG